MSPVRTSVEQNYKDLKQLWNSQDFGRKIKLRKSPADVLQKMSTLLAYVKVFMYEGGEINAYFDSPPQIRSEYLAKGNEDNDGNWGCPWPLRTGIVMGFAPFRRKN